jgi:hypothetical protein
MTLRSNALTLRRVQFLDLYTDFLITAPQQATATAMGQLLEISHDKVTRFLRKEQFTSQDLWKIVKTTVRQIQTKEGVMIIDDTVEEKQYTDQSELINWHFDHTKGKSVKGVNMVSSIYYSQNVSMPIAFEFVHKTELTIDKKTKKEKWVSKRTKNEMFQDMVTTAIRQEIPFAYVLADTWFSSVDNFIFLHEKKKDFIIPLKDNRNVAISEADRKAGNWVKLDSLVFETDTPRILYLESLPFPLAVYRAVFINADESEGILYLSSSDVTLTGSGMTTIYQSRWKVEEYHKSFKSNTCFSGSPTKLPLTQTNHFFCSLVAYVKLEWFRMYSGCNHFALKSRLYMSGLRASHADWQSLRSSVVMPRIGG